MADPFLGEIKMVGFTFAPRNWAQCNGQVMSIQQNAALYSLLGCTFGGDCKTTFQLPDLRGRAPVHPGGDISQGLYSGSESVSLQFNNLAQHTHSFWATGSDGATTKLSDQVYATAKWYTMQTPASVYQTPNTNKTILNNDTCTFVGGSQPHENRQPSLVVLFVIALAGVYPSRS